MKRKEKRARQKEKLYYKKYLDYLALPTSPVNMIEELPRTVINRFVISFDPSRIVEVLDTVPILNGNIVIDHEEVRATVLRCLQHSEHVSKASYLHTPVVIDTGASAGLSPFQGDFINYQ